MAKNNVSLLRLALLLLFATCIATMVFVAQWLLDLVGSNLLSIYNRPSHLSYLWYPSRNLDDNCRNCKDFSVNITYPLPHEGILPVGAEIRWEIRSPLLNESVASQRLENLRTTIVEDKNISRLTLSPCVQIRSFLDHANQFWESNKQDIFVFLPQKESSISMRMQASQNFNLLDHPASYTLEVAAKVGLCHLLTTRIDATESEAKGVEFFEPSAPQNRIEIHQLRPFYSLQFEPPTESGGQRTDSSRRKSDNVLIVLPATGLETNSSDSLENTRSLVEPSSSKSGDSSQSTSISSPLAKPGTSTNKKPLIMEEPLFTPPATVSKMESSIEIHGETKSVVSSSPTPAEITKLLSRKEAIDWDVIYMKALDQDRFRTSLPKMNVLSQGLFSPPVVQLQHNTPKLYRTRKVYISYPEAMASMVQSGPWNLAISFPLALLHVPGIQFYAMIDGILYDLNLSGELANVVKFNPTMLNQIKQRWEDATKEFVQFASQYEAKELTRNYPQLLQTRVLLAVEDFLPAFLEAQVYQENLYGDLRQLSIVTLPELDVGWHYVEVFATIPSQFLREKFLKSLNIIDNDVSKLSTSSLIVAFDSVRFDVVKN